MKKLNAKIYAQALFDILNTAELDQAKNIIENFLRILKRKRHLYLAASILQEFDKIIIEYNKKNALHIFACKDVNAKVLNMVKTKLNVPNEVESILNIDQGIKVGFKAIYKDTVLDVTTDSLFLRWGKQLVGL